MQATMADAQWTVSQYAQSPKFGDGGGSDFAVTYLLSLLAIRFLLLSVFDLQNFQHISDVGPC